MLSARSLRLGLLSCYRGPAASAGSKLNDLSIHRHTDVYIELCAAGLTAGIGGGSGDHRYALLDRLHSQLAHLLVIPFALELPCIAARL